MSKLLCIGDMHIDKLISTVPNFTSRVLKSFKYALKEGEEQGATDVVLAGDIFDSANPTQTSIVKFLKALEYTDMRIHIMLGNHDYSDSKVHSLIVAKWFEEHNKNIFIITEPTPLKVGNSKYMIFPHPYVENLPEGYDYGIAHFAVNGARGDNGFTVRTKHQPSGRFILGDFHTPQSGKAKKCDYEYIGSLTQLGWSEQNRKSVILLDEDGDRSRIKVKQFYELRTLTVESKEDLASIEKSDKIFYRLKTKNFMLPPSFLQEYPNVLKHSPLSAPKDKRAQVLLEESEFTLHPLKPLKPFLTSKKFDQKIVDRASKLADKLKPEGYYA